MPGLCSNLNGEQQGTEALEEHEAGTGQQWFCCPKLSLNSGSGQCPTGSVEDRRVMFPAFPAAVPTHPIASPWGPALVASEQVLLPPGMSSKNACCHSDSITHSLKCQFLDTKLYRILLQAWSESYSGWKDPSLGGLCSNGHSHE